MRAHMDPNTRAREWPLDAAIAHGCSATSAYASTHASARVRPSSPAVDLSVS